MTSPIPVAVLGTGPLADRIAAHPGLVVTEHSPVVLHLSPDPSELTALLGAGRNVVTALPLHDLPLAELAEACRAGAATLHATGGHQSAVAARLTRSLAAATGEITRLELIEEIVVPDLGADADNARTAAEAAAGYYIDGLRTLEDGAFAQRATPTPAVTIAVTTDGSGAVERVTADHDLGDRIRYRSIRSRSGAVPLRYRLVSTTAAGTGTATVDFHPVDGVPPAEHLALVELLSAARAIDASPPGIALRDLAITHLAPDDRLAGWRALP
ncbi:hypothetical protein [Nocardia asteroides]|uniref:hypothetical protein n=1 Tax=Nocardia asteroides TaxID=1824 RepID=UPI001E431546|nr:hypothetical protein [Nocardia asteroides]UGT61093.1 hypothetical protein LTT61_28805 [Nocardia asteroides]